MQPCAGVIVPVDNEASTIVPLLGRVLNAAPAEKEVIIADDDSTDGTWDIVRGWDGRAKVEVLRHECNRGKGAAIRTGLGQARGTFTIIQDGDLEYDPQDYERLLTPLLADQADVVYGSRYLSPAGRAAARWRILRLGVSLLNFCVRVLYGNCLTDEATCYKVFRTADLRAMDLQCERFEFCPEVTAKACRMGLQILEIPISYQPRSVREGKKIRLRDGWQAIRTLWRWRNWEGPSKVC